MVDLRAVADAWICRARFSGNLLGIDKETRAAIRVVASTDERTRYPALPTYLGGPDTDKVMRFVMAGPSPQPEFKAPTLPPLDPDAYMRWRTAGKMGLEEFRVWSKMGTREARRWVVSLSARARRNYRIKRHPGL